MVSNDQTIQEKLMKIRENNTLIQSKFQSILAPQYYKPICYFTSSINMGQDGQNFIIASIHFFNSGLKALQNPIFLISITTDQNIQFSGKFSQNGVSPANAAWKKLEMEQEPEKNNYWFQSTDNIAVPPGETVSFPNFQITWEEMDHYSIKIEGFAYCDAVPKGVAALSPIILFK